MLYETHFGSSVIFIKEGERWSTNDQRQILHSILLPLHLLHMSSALITVDAEKTFQGQRRRL